VRLEDVSPRTLLLATLAGWALSAWILALAGMAGRVTPLPDDPSLLQPLPQPRSASPERLGPFGQYAGIGSRPLFSEDRRPQPFSLQPEGEGEAETNTFEYVLTSVILTPTLRLAIVQPAAGGESIRIRLGDSAEEAAAWRLVALNPRSAIFEGPEGQRTLDLRTFDGTGGQAPTPVQATAEGQAASDAVATQPAAPRAPPPVPPPPKPAPPKPAAVSTDAPGNVPTAPAVQTPEAQMEAIRKRIEARRAQLRREAQQTAPAKNP
jgi:general secretion pathway protein N